MYKIDYISRQKMKVELNNEVYSYKNHTFTNLALDQITTRDINTPFQLEFNNISHNSNFPLHNNEFNNNISVE